jgi:pyruvate kinase
MCGADDGRKSRKSDPATFDSRETAGRLMGDLISVRNKVIAKAESRMDAWCKGLAGAASFVDSANLAHYLARRSLDLRHLQQALSSLGLSSLGRSESRVLPAINAVLASLRSAFSSSPRCWRWTIVSTTSRPAFC